MNEQPNELEREQSRPIQPETKTIEIKVPQQRGMESGEVGTAGLGMPGPNYLVISTPRWKMALEYVSWFFFKTWIGLTGTNAFVGFVEPSASAMDEGARFVSWVLRITVLAVGATAIALAGRLYTWWEQSRQKRGLPV